MAEILAKGDEVLSLLPINWWNWPKKVKCTFDGVTEYKFGVNIVCDSKQKTKIFDFLTFNKLINYLIMGTTKILRKNNLKNVCSKIMKA